MKPSSRRIATLALVLPAIGAAAPAAGVELDWCAPVVIRPDQKFDNAKDCHWVWSKQEIAEQTDVVYMSGETAVGTPKRPPHPMTCWGDTTFENMARYIDEVNALRPADKPPIQWVAMVRFDIVFDTFAAQPGFTDEFLAKTNRPWSTLLDFFRKDRSGACPPEGCTWRDAWGGRADCNGQCLRDYIDGAGGPGAAERAVYYLNLWDHPIYWPSAALARQDNAKFRTWIIAEHAKAISMGHATMIDLNNKFWQWLPSNAGGGGVEVGGPKARDVAALRKTEAGWTGTPIGYGYPEYVKGWAALASELKAANVPFSVIVGRALFTQPKLYDDPSTADVDEAKLIRDVAEQKAKLVLLATDGDRAGAAGVAARLRSLGRTVLVIDQNCGLAKGRKQ
jgi:hypothetical protein